MLIAQKLVLYCGSFLFYLSFPPTTAHIHIWVTLLTGRGRAFFGCTIFLLSTEYIPFPHATLTDALLLGTELYTLVCAYTFGFQMPLNS
jgi:hypothetical protein